MQRVAYIVLGWLVLATHASGQNINANLCQIGPKGGNVDLLSPRATVELDDYLSGLRGGKFSFAWSMEPHQAAFQLGFGKRFAAIYGQAAEEAQTRMTRNGTITIGEIIDYLAGALREERSVDALTLQHEQHFAAIVYLRALQAAECSFPNVFHDTPTGQEVLSQLIAAYPALLMKQDDRVFLDIYSKTVVSARERAHQAGSVSIYRIIEDWRNAIVR